MANIGTDVVDILELAEGLEYIEVAGAVMEHLRTTGVKEVVNYRERLKVLTGSKYDAITVDVEGMNGRMAEVRQSTRQ